ncbi:glycosyltransferase family 39 protein [Curtobacterium sp. ISL-83]|uniref:glycosyltransferase family 39 protein n=1 Tax=Curtobacterium sp. ISL-83 TaxID=2819145 RepID=UPI001BEC1C5D|nr:glycosyltransferase family 39 protein [Curtobacterium sp. ISL-83]MBT2501045.1 glycosyltransferase family 39 protein [Curtobacterium sp. ISL-83]
MVGPTLQSVARLRTEEPAVPAGIAGRAAVLGVVAMVLSAIGSWIPSLWGDEGTSVMSAQRSIPSLLRMLGNVDAVHGLYYGGLHAWVDVFGASPFSVRFPSAIAVGLLTAAVVLIVHELRDDRLAVVAGIVCAVLPRVTYMGEEARSYAFSAAIAAWAAWVLVRILTGRSDGKRWWWAYTGLLALGIWTFMFSVLLLAVHATVVLASRPGRAVLRRWALAAGTAVVLASPVIVFGLLERGQVAFLAHRTTITFKSLTVGLWFTSVPFALLAWALILIAVLAAAVPAVRAWAGRTQSDAVRTTGPTAIAAPMVTPTTTRTGPSLVLLGAAWLVLPTTILVLASAVHPMFSGRYMSYSAPAAAILMACGIAWLAERVRRPTVISAVAVVVVLIAAAPVWASQRTPYAKNNSDWAEISATIGARAVPGDAIVFDESARPSQRPRLAEHTYPEGFRNVRDVTLQIPYARSTTWRDTAMTPARAAALGRFAGVDRVWLVEYATPTHTDTYGMEDLEDLGFRPGVEVRTHRSVIREYVRS